MLPGAATTILGPLSGAKVRPVEHRGNSIWVFDIIVGATDCSMSKTLDILLNDLSQFELCFFLLHTPILME